jgi:hypothetical protein
VKIPIGGRQAYVTVTSLTDALVEGDETFNVELSNVAGVAGIQIGRAVGTGTIKDATGVPAGQLLIGSQTIVEIDSCAKCKATSKFSVVLSAPTAQQVTVNYSTADAGASAGADYNAKLNKTLTFKVGATTRKFVTVITLGDLIPEPTESIDVVFSNPVNAALDNGNTGHIDILDND